MTPALRLILDLWPAAYLYQSGAVVLVYADEGAYRRGDGPVAVLREV